MSLVERRQGRFGRLSAQDSDEREVRQRPAILAARFDLRLRYARALVVSGQKDAAKKELRAIVDAKEDVNEKKAAAEMLQKL